MARIRTFLALAIDDYVQDKLVQVQRKLARETTDVKWVDRSSFHLTLLFLGEVPELDLVPICRVVEKVSKNFPPFRMRIRGLGAFPTPRRPKVLFAGITQGQKELQLLHEELEAPLLDLGCYRREERAFTPHVTLGFVKAADDEPAWSTLLTNYAQWDGSFTNVKQILVMASETRREGQEYSILGRGDLRGDPLDLTEEEEEVVEE